MLVNVVLWIRVYFVNIHVFVNTIHATFRNNTIIYKRNSKKKIWIVMRTHNNSYIIETTLPLSLSFMNTFFNRKLSLTLAFLTISHYEWLLMMTTKITLYDYWARICKYMTRKLWIKSCLFISIMRANVLLRYRRR